MPGGSRRHANEQEGHRGNLPPPERIETNAWAQALSVSATPVGRHPDPTMSGPWTSATSPWRGDCLSLLRRRLVQPEGLVVAAVDHDGSRFLYRGGRGALARYGKPDIFNTDQGSQFTSVDFTTVLKKAEIAISMDGKGSWRDNVFVERIWRSISTPTKACPRPALASADI